MTGQAIGIDLGTTYSCVAGLLNGKIEIIPDDEGNRTIPSCVAFTKTMRLIGNSAKQHAVMDPPNTVFDSKRLIGRRFDDPAVVEDMKLWPFTVTNDNSRPVVVVKHKGKEKKFLPEEISAMILQKLKEMAEARLNKEIKKAVITVPAYFNNAQREATQLAGEIAGLEVLRIINEPTAAAVAYGFNKNVTVEKTVLIFDLGGGTFDVSILNIDRGILEVLSTAGDTHLGGEDFDKKMVDFLIKEIKGKYKTDISQNKKAVGRLRSECQKAKTILSVSQKASMYLESLFEGTDFQRCIQRSEFNELCSDTFREVFTTVDKALRDAELKKDDIEEIILVGGSTRIPDLQDRLKDYFEGKEVSKGINPDEAVALGAAVQAAILVGDKTKILDEIILIDVVPLSLGIETVGGVMTVMVERNSSIPLRKERIFTTVSDNATVLIFKVFEGERSMTKDNNLLGTFTLNGIPEAPRGVPKILVTIGIDENGILNASAREESSRNEVNITISSDKGRPSEEEIQRMITEADIYRQEDEQHRQRVAARNALEGYIYSVLNTIKSEKVKGSVADNDGKLMEQKCEEVMHWIELNENAGKDQFEHHLVELKRYVRLPKGTNY